VRRPIALAGLLAALVAAAAAPAGASPGAGYGIQDDAWLLGGPGELTQRIGTLQLVGVKLVRFTLRWDKIAPTRPARPHDPADPAYEWGRYEDVLDALHGAGISALVTIYGAPVWSNGGHAPNWLPASTAIGDFAYAASKEFPWIRLWTAWNEPNTRTFSVPVSPALYVSRVLNPAYAGLHRADGRNRVAGGVTSPRQPPSGMAPSVFAAGMSVAHARLDAYAQNPYPLSPSETPFATSCASCLDWTMARLGAIRADVTRDFGSKPIWLTEYGYQTNPPDTILGVSLQRQASYIGEAALRVWEQAGVTMLIQFLVQDEPAIGGWQSGLFTDAGKPKPSYHAFGLPLAEVSRSGGETTLWGEVRPGSGRRVYRIQRFTGGRWIAAGAAARTRADGAFEQVLPLPRGARVRLTSPGVGYASAALVIS
jgi:hypothetical protein